LPAQASRPAARLANDLSTGTLRAAFAAFLGLMAVYLAFRALTRKENKGGRRPVAWPWSALVGASGGLLSGLFGVGGATIAPPALSAFFGLSQTAAAQGLALALIAPGTVVALVVYAQAGAVDWSMGIPLAVGGLVAVSAGVSAAHKLHETKLRLLFSGFLVFTAIMLGVHG
jgi:uncharacterized membrane protein YfcA